VNSIFFLFSSNLSRFFLLPHLCGLRPAYCKAGIVIVDFDPEFNSLGPVERWNSRNSGSITGTGMEVEKIPDSDPVNQQRKQADLSGNGAAKVLWLEVKANIERLSGIQDAKFPCISYPIDLYSFC